jgi:transporter family protein
MAIAFALCSAVLFGAMTTFIRRALEHGADADEGAVAAVLIAFAIALPVAIVAAAWPGPARLGASWPFVAAGILSPGVAQIFVTLALRDAGASRTSIAFGTAPLVSVVLALTLLGEPLRAPLVVGAVLIVAGGLALAAERDRPEHVRPIGLIYALAGVALFASRDNLLRWLARHDAPVAPVAAAVTLGIGVVVTLAWSRRLPTLRSLRSFALGGVAFGVSYLCLFEAYYRGRVTVVSPLVATESLWGVLIAATLLRHTELVGRRLVAGALLVVAGGALIGGFR